MKYLCSVSMWIILLNIRLSTAIQLYKADEAFVYVREL